MIESEKKRVSSDRLHRYVNENQKSKILDENYLVLGDFAIFNIDDSFVVCHVMGFFYMTGVATYTLEHCPIVLPESAEKRGIGVIGSFYSVVSETNELKEISHIRHVNIDSFEKHVRVSLTNNKFYITE